MTYAGNKLFNPNNGSFMVVLAIFIYMLFTDVSKNRLSDINIFGALVVFMFLLTILEAFYFELTDTELLVHNYILGFMTLSYKLADITEIKVMDTTFRSTAKAGLKIIRDDKRSLAFRAAGLGIDDWRTLILDLGAKQIDVNLSASRLVKTLS